MKALLASHDLTARKARRLPWRLAAEVAARADPKRGTVSLVSLRSDAEAHQARDLPDGVRAVAKSRRELGRELAELVRELECEALFWPMSWREPAWRLAALASLPVAKVAYFPGGVFELRPSLYALRRLGPRQAAPYLLDSLSPKRRKLRLLRAAGFTDLIAHTPRTTAALVAAGWPEPRAHFVPPGREAPRGARGAALPPPFAEWLGDHLYFLFLGPPSRIRGLFELLAAFELASDRLPSLRLACLFRPDATLDSADIRRRIERSRARDRIYCEWSSLVPASLEAFVRRARAVVLPSVLVPCEIPLAILESMALGRPVVCTSPSGTADFAAAFGHAPAVGDISALARALLTLAQDEATYRAKCDAARTAWQRLPDWQEMASRWQEIADQARRSASGVG